MRWIGIGLGAVVALLLLLVASFFLASESGEVVVLHTTDAEGQARETRVWVVDHDGFAWLRRGSDSGWILDLASSPDVEVERNAERLAFRVVLVRDGETRDRINELVLEKYGAAERYLRFLMIDPASAIAVRLEPRAPGDG